MKLSTLSVSLYGTLAVSALSLPKRAAQHVDLSEFEANTFQLIDLDEVKAAAKFDAASSQIGTNAEDITSATCANPRVRVEWRNMASNDKTAFIRAIKCLLSKPSGGHGAAQNRYEDLVAVHQQMTSSIHMVGQFLPWHRYFVFIFESLLRDECGYRGPLPWWDETKDAGRFSSAPLFTDQYFGPAPIKTSDRKGTCVESGPFGGLTLHVGPGSSNRPHCLSRAVDETSSAWCNSGFVQTCNSLVNYVGEPGMENCTEKGPHAYGHNGIGAVMSDVMASPGDPIFFMHHGFVDHSWRTWQTADPANRLYQIGGFSDRAHTIPLTLDYVLSSQGLKPEVKVRDVMDTTGTYLCYEYDY